MSDGFCRISILGCGWLGLPLGAYLVAAGHQVRGSTTSEDKLNALASAGLKPYLLTLKPEIQDPGNFFESDLLVITIPPRNQQNDDRYYFKQLENIKKQACKSKVDKVLFISSTGAYKNTGGVVKEADASLKAKSRGGVSLLEAEEHISSGSTYMTTILRFGGLFGPSRHPGRFLAGKTNLAGASNPINMIHLDDCIRIIDLIIQKGVWGETFNACCPSSITREAFYIHAAKELQLPPPHFSDEPAPYKVVDCSKLHDRLGYEFIHKL